MSDSGPERRQHARVALGVDVDFTSDANFFSGRTRDLSVGGLFIETEVGLRVGAQVVINLRLLDQGFDVTAEVTWVLVGDAGEPVGMGVRFVSLPDATRDAIESFMRMRPPMSFEMLESDAPAPGGPRDAKKPPPLPR